MKQKKKCAQDYNKMKVMRLITPVSHTSPDNSAWKRETSVTTPGLISSLVIKLATDKDFFTS
jgi:hypothetical protein